MRNRTGTSAKGEGGSREPKHSDSITDRREMGKRLRHAREMRGLVQAELGTAVGVSRAAVSQWEAGDVQVTLDRLKAAAERLEVNLSWLLSGEGESPLVEAPRAGGRPRAKIPTAEGVLTEMHDVTGYHSVVADDWWRLPPLLLRDLPCNDKTTKIFHVKGASMEPTINRNAYVLVDLSQNAPNDEQVYVIHSGISLIVRRVHIHKTGRQKPMVELSTDASKRVTNVAINRVKIVGRVVAQLVKPI